VEQWCLMWGRLQLRRVRLVAQTALAARLAAQMQFGARGDNTNSTEAVTGIPSLVRNMPGGWEAGMPAVVKSSIRQPAHVLVAGAWLEWTQREVVLRST
jgi:hypothetical protein